MLNENDDFSMRRIINRPKRGIGKIALANIEKVAFDKKTSLFNAFSELGEKDVSKKSLEALHALQNGIKSLSGEERVDKIIDALEATFGLKAYYASLPDGADRLANIDEFLAMLKDEALNKNSFDLEEFLNELSLLSEQDAIGTDGISVMSVHASKGLEFAHLFVIGLEEGFFPLLGDGSDIEEERRLAYVAITRAKSNLTLSYVGSRFYKGKRERLEKSRFLSEAGLCEGKLILDNGGEFKKGDLISHKLFGMGRVTAVDKARGSEKLTINFGGISRVIMSNFVQKII